jgi:hypothetical protein
MCLDTSIACRNTPGLWVRKTHGAQPTGNPLLRCLQEKEGGGVARANTVPYRKRDEASIDVQG